MSASSPAGQQPQQPQQPQQQPYVIENVKVRFPPGTNAATKRLVQGILRRTITPDGIQRLIRKGADPRVCIDLITTWTSGHERYERWLRVCLLSLAIDDWSTPTALEAPLGIGLPGTDAGRLVLPLEQYEAAMMGIYTYLVKLDPSLANEAIVGSNVIHRAAMVGRTYSEGFIHGYLQLMMDNGASIDESAVLPEAARNSSYHVIEWLCQHLSPAQIKTATDPWPFRFHRTPLGIAARRVAELRSQDDGEEDPLVPRDATVSGMQRAIRTLLTSGAAIAMVRTPQQLPPDARQQARDAHSVVLAEYLTVLNDKLPKAVMDGVNGALNPQRDAASVLTRLLPLARPAPPTTATDTSTAAAAHAPAAPSPFALTDATAQVAWKIGAFLHEPEAVDTITLGQPVVAHRIKRAMQRFVKCAATKTADNEEVIGGMANVGGRVVRVPLQCFAVREGPTVRRVGLREVVHRARLDEAARYGLTGVVKGFNSHLGNDDCQFGWGQLGWVNDIGLFQPLGIN
ncbi:unnamed protein product [Vitrella brassicaformis CCMP3155]|uniref:Uncharacterized protein n=1 Tax=Vitrella brassicaformis (strain CCMP3155) TaxID=1169540 RepID=A0A0G4FJQ1_VITBC|nr:unnamed protein product [Vitrella brassicaformis CCMP3155]|eukprot:CEM13978.1 unnamed protein product [Vitrella brassicaformis CCMP3155]